jgi:hypothetical protein
MRRSIRAGSSPVNPTKTKLTEENMSHIESTIETWWKSFHITNEGPRPTLTKRVQNKKIVDAMLNAADMLGVDSDQVKTLMKMMLPRKASDNESISFFNDYNKYNLGLIKHRTKTAPGKFFRKIFPDASNTFVEAFAAFYQTNILFDADDYVLSIGETKEDFKQAFRSYCRTRGNFDFRNNSASISDSCMRYAFDRLSDHPSVVYASGDFKVITVKTKGGKTRARCVVGLEKDTGKFMPNRIYASCNYSKQMIVDYLAAAETTICDWSGLKLLKIKSTSNRGYYLCPFIDNHRYVCIYDEDHLVIRAGTYETYNSTSGSVCFSNYDQPPTWEVNRGAKPTKQRLKAPEGYF